MKNVYVQAIITLLPDCRTEDVQPPCVPASHLSALMVCILGSLRSYADTMTKNQLREENIRFNLLLMVYHVKAGSQGRDLK